MGINVNPLKNKSPSDLLLNASQSTLILLSVVLFSTNLSAIEIPMKVQMLVYLGCMIGINLPHGGFEHFNNLRNRDLNFGAKYLIIYVAFVLSFIGFFLIEPVPALMLAFGTAVLKGGHSDLMLLKSKNKYNHITNKIQFTLGMFVRGGAIMIVPLYFWTDIYHTFTVYMLNLFGSDPVSYGYLQSASVFLIATYGLAFVSYFAYGYINQGKITSSLKYDLFESSILVLFFITVPMMMAVGIYFAFWYTIRQSSRSMNVDTKYTENERDVPPIIAWSVMIAGASLTAIFASTLYLIMPNSPFSLGLLAGLVSFYTIFVCIIALPHVVVGQWLDDRGIWHVP